jgi:ribose 5-phosphate isomerase B
MKIAIAFDHAGRPLLDAVTSTVTEAGDEAVVLGWSGDYPDIALAVGTAILNGDADRGILICGSGAGVAVAATKIDGIRAACAHDHYTAAQCVEHDDVNVLCLGARVVGSNVAVDLVTAFLAANFTGEERHVRRVGKIREIELEGAGAHLGNLEPVT